MYMVIKVVRSLYLWQISILVAIFLLFLGFTGSIPYTDITIEAGHSDQAIVGGALFFLLSVNIKLMSMLIERRKDDR